MNSKYLSLIRKLQTALAANGIVTLVSQNQFWSELQKRQITVYVVYETEYDYVGNKRKQHEVLRTCVQIDVLIYLSNRFKNLGIDESLDAVSIHREESKCPNNDIVYRVAPTKNQKQKAAEIINKRNKVNDQC